MAFIPYDTVPASSTGEEQKQSGILETLLPRASEYVGGIARAGVDTAGQIGDIVKGQFGTPKEKKQAGKSFLERQKKIEKEQSRLGFKGYAPTGKTYEKAAGAAGEIAPFFFGVPEAKALPASAGAMSRVINRIIPLTKTGAATGITHGLTTPEAGVEERVKKATSEGLAGAATASTLGLLFELVKPISSLFKGVGKGITRRVVQPEVGQGPGWATRAGKATETLLKKSGKLDITPAKLDKSIEKTLSETTKVIKSHLGEIPEEFATKDIHNLATEKVGKKVIGFGRRTLSKATKKKADKTIFYLQDILEENGTRMRGKAGFSINLEKLFEAKQQIGQYLQEPGNVFYKMARNHPLEQADKIQLAYYDALKGIIDNLSDQYSKAPLNISDLTQMEHELYQASRGVQALGEKQIGKVSPFAIEKLPFISLILSMLESAELAGGRAFYEAGKFGEKLNVPTLIQKIVAGQTAIKKD